MNNKKTSSSDINEDSPKEKKLPTCFVIMPISDMHGYDAGHFSRVYEYLIKPAAIAAGYIPVRADDTSKTDYIVVGIIQKIIESEMIICDLSGKNANVLYELGIRHAFNKPVTLICDDNTEKIFDIQGLRYTQYAASLRIDKAQSEIAKIKTSIEQTGDPDNKDINSIVKMAGVHAAETPDKTTISNEASIILSAIKQIDSRITKIEKESSLDVQADEEIVLANGETVSVGEILFSNGQEIGRLQGKMRNKNLLLVVGSNGEVKAINNNLPKYRFLSALPF